MFVKCSRFTPSPSLDKVYGLTLILHCISAFPELFSKCLQAYSYCLNFFDMWTSKPDLFLLLFKFVRWILYPRKCEEQKRAKKHKVENDLKKSPFLVLFRAPRQDQLLFCCNITVFSILFLKASQYGAFAISSGNLSQCFSTLITSGLFF